MRKNAFACNRGSVPDPTGGAYIAFPNSLDAFYLEGKTKGVRRGRKGKERIYSFVRMTRE